MLQNFQADNTKGNEKVRINSSELKMGMFVCELDRPWVESPFLVHGFSIKDQTQLSQLQSLCSYVHINLKKSQVKDKVLGATKPSELKNYENNSSFEKHFAQAQTLHTEAKLVVTDMFESFRTGQIFDVTAVRDVVSGCVDNIIANPDPMFWLSMIKDKDSYTAEHSLNVSTLSIALGRAEGLDEESLAELGVCAMLHDVGKIKIPDNILNKEGQLDDKEFSVMKSHTIQGKKILMRETGIPPLASEAALSHHERIDGKGYPQGIKGDQIPYFVRIIAIADAYDAMTSGRVYSDAKPAAEALKLLLQAKDSQVDAAILANFVECVGVYPIGSICELNTGELGLILPSSCDNKLFPRVLVLLGNNKQPCEQRVLDLKKDKRADNNRSYMIRALHADGCYGIKIKDYRDIVNYLQP